MFSGLIVVMSLLILLVLVVLFCTIYQSLVEMWIIGFDISMQHSCTLSVELHVFVFICVVKFIFVPLNFLNSIVLVW